MTLRGQLETPVAFVLFRRPDRTRRVFEAIRCARPRRLFLIADGPRPGAAEEQLECERARAVVEDVDWPCEVIRDFADANVGLKHRLPSGLDRVFREVDRAIVLEDDCLPHETIFRFFDELLEGYAGEDRVIHFDVELREWHDLERAAQDQRLRSMFAEESERRYWRHVWDSSPEIENWDAQWSYALLARHGLAANPNRNLISNIGFGTDATNAIEDPLGIAARPLEGMRFPLEHPDSVERDDAADAAASRFFRRDHPAAVMAPLRQRAWAATLRAGGRALDFVPARIRPRIRHRDR